MAAEKSQQQTVPLVDFGQFLNGSQADKKKAASELDSAFRTVGFVYLQNHGVPQERVEKCFSWVSVASHLLLHP
jgi:isopenicillin N synthase-like dioxygenase